jgi:hypothetical protein
MLDQSELKPRANCTYFVIYMIYSLHIKLSSAKCVSSVAYLQMVPRLTATMAVLYLSTIVLVGDPSQLLCATILATKQYNLRQERFVQHVKLTRYIMPRF